MGRTLTTVASLAAVALFASSALGAPVPKKKKKKHATPPATATIEIDNEDPKPGPAPDASPPPPPAEEPATTTEVAHEPKKKGHHAAAKGDAGALPWSVGLLIGYGFDGAEHFGIGARGGYTLPMHLYVGATFVFHAGSSAGGGSANLLYPGIEAGYDFDVGPVILRPYAGFGPVFVRTSLPTTMIGNVTEGGGTSVTTFFGGWIGGLAMVTFATRLFAGGDVRLDLVSEHTSVTLLATGGVRF